MDSKAVHPFGAVNVSKFLFISGPVVDLYESHYWIADLSCTINKSWRLANLSYQLLIKNIIERMSSESGKLVSSIEIKSCADVFHEIFRHRPHEISEMSPTKIKACDLHEGDWGTVGSVIFWNYTHDEKEKVAKEIIEAIDEEKKSVKFKVIEGDLLELYKTFSLTCHVDTDGENNLVTWTLEYEKLNDSVEDPHTLMEFCLHVTKDIETHHSK